MNTKKIGIITSRGGHLYQMHLLKPWWKHYDRFWVTFEGVDTQSLLTNERVYYGFAPDTRHIFNAVRHLFLALRILRRERPHLIVSCGAGIAPPFFLVAKLLGIKTVFIEVYDFLTHSTLSGKLVAPMCDTMLIQHKQQQQFYPHAIYKGPIL